MTKRRLRLIASALILVALALLVVGLQLEESSVWGLGLVVTGVAMAVSLATRWVGGGPD